VDSQLSGGKRGDDPIGGAVAQDPTVVDANHYKVMFENDQVRVLKITYGPKEKSVMHEHPNAVAVFLTDGQMKFQLADGKSICPSSDALRQVEASAKGGSGSVAVLA
jgi:quercetin dioxygenase-like cupin family protein